MSASYIDLCTIRFKMYDTVNIKMLHSFAVKNKVDAVTFFVDSNDMFIVFESYLTNCSYLHKVKSNIMNIVITDMNNVRYDAEINNERFNESGVIADNNNKIGECIDKTLQNFEKKTFIRFAATTNILKALALFQNQEIILDVNENIQLTEGTTRLTIGRPRTLVELDDYLINYTNMQWDRLDIDGVGEIAKALIKTKDTVYKMYIALEGDKIYSHNTSFLIERVSENVHKRYILPYITIETIKALSSKVDTYISKDDDKIVINYGGMFIAWNVGRQVEETSNLLSILKRDNFVRMATINRGEWEKVSILKDYSDVDSDQDVTIVINNGTITALKDNNITSLKADVADHDISFDVGIDSLLIAKDLAGSNPLIYVDSTGKDNVLVFYNELMVVIAISNLKINKLDQYPRTLSETISAVQSRNKKTEIEAIDFSQINLANTESIQDDLQDIEIADDDIQINDIDLSIDMSDILNTSLAISDMDNNDMTDIDINAPSFIIPPAPPVN